MSKTLVSTKSLSNWLSHLKYQPSKVKWYAQTYLVEETGYETQACWGMGHRLICIIWQSGIWNGLFRSVIMILGKQFYLGGLNNMWHIHCWNISHVTCKCSLTFQSFQIKTGKKEMKEQQIFLGISVFPMAWILWNSPACMPKWSKDYEIRKNSSRDL